MPQSVLTPEQLAQLQQQQKHDERMRLVASIIGVGGSALEGWADRRDRAADRQFNAAEATKDRAQRQREMIANFLSGQADFERDNIRQEQHQDRQDATRALGVMGGPFGMADDLQRQRVRRDLLANARNITIAAPPDIEAARGAARGGLRVPSATSSPAIPSVPRTPRDTY